MDGSMDAITAEDLVDIDEDSFSKHRQLDEFASQKYPALAVVVHSEMVQWRRETYTTKHAELRPPRFSSANFSSAQNARDRFDYSNFQDPHAAEQARRQVDDELALQTFATVMCTSSKEHLLGVHPFDTGLWCVAKILAKRYMTQAPGFRAQDYCVCAVCQPRLKPWARCMKEQEMRREHSALPPGWYHRCPCVSCLYWNPSVLDRNRHPLRKASMQPATTLAGRIHEISSFLDGEDEGHVEEEEEEEEDRLIFAAPNPIHTVQAATLTAAQCRAAVREPAAGYTTTHGGPILSAAAQSLGNDVAAPPRMGGINHNVPTPGPGASAADDAAALPAADTTNDGDIGENGAPASPSVVIIDDDDEEEEEIHSHACHQQVAHNVEENAVAAQIIEINDRQDNEVQGDVGATAGPGAVADVDHVGHVDCRGYTVATGSIHGAVGRVVTQEEGFAPSTANAQAGHEREEDEQIAGYSPTAHAGQMSAAQVATPMGSTPAAEVQAIHPDDGTHNELQPRHQPEQGQESPGRVAWQEQGPHVHPGHNAELLDERQVIGQNDAHSQQDLCAAQQQDSAAHHLPNLQVPTATQTGPSEAPTLRAAAAAAAAVRLLTTPQEATSHNVVDLTDPAVMADYYKKKKQVALNEQKRMRMMSAGQSLFSPGLGSWRQTGPKPSPASINARQAPGAKGTPNRLKPTDNSASARAVSTPPARRGAAVAGEKRAAASLTTPSPAKRVNTGGMNWWRKVPVVAREEREDDVGAAVGSEKNARQQETIDLVDDNGDAEGGHGPEQPSTGNGVIHRTRTGAVNKSVLPPAAGANNTDALRWRTHCATGAGAAAQSAGGSARIASVGHGRMATPASSTATLAAAVIGQDGACGPTPHATRNIAQVQHTARLPTAQPAGASGSRAAATAVHFGAAVSKAGTGQDGRAGSAPRSAARQVAAANMSAAHQAPTQIRAQPAPAAARHAKATIARHNTSALRAALHCAPGSAVSPVPLSTFLPAAADPSGQPFAGPANSGVALHGRLMHATTSDHNPPAAAGIHPQHPAPGAIPAASQAAILLPGASTPSQPQAPPVWSRKLPRQPDALHKQPTFHPMHPVASAAHPAHPTAPALVQVPANQGVGQVFRRWPTPHGNAVSSQAAQAHGAHPGSLQEATGVSQLAGQGGAHVPLQHAHVPPHQPQGGLHVPRQHAHVPPHQPQGGLHVPRQHAHIPPHQPQGGQHIADGVAVGHPQVSQAQQAPQCFGALHAPATHGLAPSQQPGGTVTPGVPAASYLGNTTRTPHSAPGRPDPSHGADNSGEVFCLMLCPPDGSTAMDVDVDLDGCAGAGMMRGRMMPHESGASMTHPTTNTSQHVATSNPMQQAAAGNGSYATGPPSPSAGHIAAWGNHMPQHVLPGPQPHAVPPSHHMPQHALPGPQPHAAPPNNHMPQHALPGPQPHAVPPSHHMPQHIRHLPHAAPTVPSSNSFPQHMAAHHMPQSAQAGHYPPQHMAPGPGPQVALVVDPVQQYNPQTPAPTVPTNHPMPQHTAPGYQPVPGVHLMQQPMVQGPARQVVLAGHPMLQHTGMGPWPQAVPAVDQGQQHIVQGPASEAVLGGNSMPQHVAQGAMPPTMADHSWGNLILQQGAQPMPQAGQPDMHHHHMAGSMPQWGAPGVHA